MTYDIENISLEDLLALALRDTASVKELATKYNSPKSLHQASLDDLTKVKGVGKKKAFQILAMLELSRRIITSPPNTNPVITCPTEVVAMIEDTVQLLDREHFIVYILDIKNRILTSEVASVGSLNSSIVHPREIFKKAVKISGASIILVHNHPSGDPTPSSEDIAVTKRLVQAGEVLGINVLDHVIIGSGKFTSLRETGVI